VNGVVDEDEAGEDAEVEDEPGEQIRFGVAGVDLATQRGSIDEQLDEGEPRPQSPSTILVVPNASAYSARAISIVENAWLLANAVLASAANSRFLSATDPPTRDTYRITVLNEQSV